MLQDTDNDSEAEKDREETEETLKEEWELNGRNNAEEKLDARESEEGEYNVVEGIENRIEEQALKTKHQKRNEKEHGVNTIMLESTKKLIYKTPTE